MSDIVFLDARDRDRFATWLELEAQTSRGIIEQLKKLGPVGAVLIQREEDEIRAATIIARKLRSIEDQIL